MNKQKEKNKAPYKLFAAIFILVVVMSVVNSIRRGGTVTLTVPDNAGVSVLETVGSSLMCVFKDGQVCRWNWNDLAAGPLSVSLGTDRVFILNQERFGGVSKDGSKFLFIYDFKSGKKIQEIKVGWEDQAVGPIVSFDKDCVALVRRSSSSDEEKTIYEFLTIDLDSELLSSPVVLSTFQDEEAYVQYAFSSNKILYAVGSKGEQGRIAALNMDTGKILWDRLYDNTKEFCSIILSSDHQYILAGNRDGILYKLDAQSGEMIKKIQLLEDGETRAVFNDYSVFNLAFSPDGKYYVATIHPLAYILEPATDTVVHKFSPADKLVSKLAFSPDNKFIATSDIRAGYPIKIWKFPEENKQ